MCRFLTYCRLPTMSLIYFRYISKQLKIRNSFYDIQRKEQTMRFLDTKVNPLDLVLVMVNL